MASLEYKIDKSKINTNGVYYGFYTECTQINSDL